MTIKYPTRGGLALLAVPLLLSGCITELPGEFPDQETLCTFDASREAQRAASVASFPQPEIQQLLVNGELRWSAGSANTAQLNAGDEVTLKGSGFGGGTDIDFSKIMLGNTRILETDLRMFTQYLAINDQVNFESDEQFDSWDKNILSWNDSEIRFRVPDHASSGPLIVQVQKRTGFNESLKHPGQAHNVIDAQTSRIISDTFEHDCDVVSTLSDAKSTTPIAVSVNNPGFEQLVEKGRQAFWSYDYNIGVAHSVRKLDWNAIFNYKANDPIAGGKADPAKLFGAVKTVRGEVPDEAIDDVYFNSYPMATPIPGFLTTQPAKFKGNTRDSGWVGYRYAEANEPYKGNGEWIGFNCASCHGYKVSYEKAPGQAISKVIPGLPNPNWSMKWTVLQTLTNTFDGIYTSEEGPSWNSGKKDIAKDMLLYHMPAGAGEHNMVRVVGEGSHTDNDYQFSPIAIPNVTNYMAIRRSLSHTESYVGFEGSYIHSEEPDGAQGAMSKEWLEALTAYMTTLDQDDDDLRNVGLYRWLKYSNKLSAQTGNAQLSEGEFVQSGWQQYADVSAAVNRGKATYERDCSSCHSDGVGANTNEKMVRLDEVGRFFTPTIYQKETESVRATFLRDLYWTQHRGLLSDGHVRNLEDLVSPQRCTPGSNLYNNYYTLHAPVRPDAGGPDHVTPFPDLNRKGDVFRVPKSKYLTKLDKGYKRNLFIERHKYFVSVPWDKDHYYWDYQKMRAEYGPDEMGTAEPIGMPAAPHPWCAQNSAEVDDLVQYLLTL
ncbi:cytochrome c [Thalassolituus sp. C2-1]|uniref:cytochrome c n=1 Tax=Venatorbacter sp. C2-1 TaxID=2597518 RepID=UPI001196B068|nr:cytochrome c [Thalassolituus sp. C2-1]TVV43302.1 cytochrome c [Thalassolituus sp. C2-1]